MPGISPGAMSKSFRARSQGRQFRIRPTDLLLMASAASATSLSNFQFVTSGSISLGCFIAYNTPFRGCTEGDFGGGRTCSAFCMRAIERVTRHVQSACESFEPATNSLLDLTMSGRLLEVLCPNNGDDDDDDATETTTKTNVASTTCTTDGPTTVQDTKMHTCPSSSSPSSTAATADPPQGETTAPPPPLTDDGNVPTVTSTVTPAEPTEEDFDPLASGGGGSPFDPIQFSGAAGLPGRGLMGPWSLVFAVASVAVFGI